MNHEELPSLSDLPLEDVRKIDALCDQFEAAFDTRKPLEISTLLEEVSPQVAPYLKRELLAIEAKFRGKAGWLNDGQLLPREDDVGYCIDGEIASGGMGTVLRAVDKAFDRVLAMKTILPKWRGTEVERRFLNEARLTGRLQHPGIPPIHTIGSLGDGRPFFTMKFISGRTLSELLKQRDKTAADRAKLLGIFEHICQTVAYAHNEGVIHRDLKPLNIMVGAFGEVQVMDWGMAKRLSDTLEAGPRNPSDANTKNAAKQAARDTDLPDTVAWNDSTRDSHLAIETDDASQQSAVELTREGAVMGTLAYMPPEQARGEIQSIDRRSDVFGLGAILCEILTGRRVYTGEDIPRQAATGNIDAAFRRLSECGADAELVDLCRQCLSPIADDRPADASAVAQEVRRWEEAVQRRLEREKADRAAAEATAVEEKKRAAVERTRNRLWLSLTMAVLIVVALGAAGVIYVQQQRQAEEMRKAQQEHVIRSGLEQVATLRRSKRPDEAAIALERTRSLLLDIGNIELHARAAEEARLLTLLDDLEATRMRQLDAVNYGRVDGRIDFQPISTEFQRLLSDVGIYARDDAAKDIAGRIGESEIRQELLESLNRWTSITSDESQREHLLAIAREVDPHAQRNRIRDPAAWRSNAKLGELINDIPAEDWTPSLALAVTGRLFFAETRSDHVVVPVDHRIVIALLRKLALRRPDDVWLSHRLATILLTSSHAEEDPEAAITEGVGYLRAALALRPDVGHLWGTLGTALNIPGNSEAVDCFQEGVRLMPENSNAARMLAEALAARGDMKEAVQYHQESIRLADDKANADGTNTHAAFAHWSYARTLSMMGKESEALEELQAASRLEPNFSLWEGELGRHYQKHKDNENAIDHYGKAVALFTSAANPFVEPNPILGDYLLQYAKCLRNADRFSEAISALERYNSFSYSSMYGRLLLGECLHNDSRHAEAIPILEEFIAQDQGSSSAYTLLGRCHLVTGNFAEAHAEFEKALEPPSRDPSSIRPLVGARRAEVIQWKRQCETIMPTERRFRAYERGELDASPEDLIVFGRLCFFNAFKYHAATEVFKRAFEEQPELAPRAASRVFAACAAGLAACGKGNDAHELSEAETLELARTSLKWFREELEILDQQRRDGQLTEEDVDDWLTLLRELKVFPGMEALREGGFPIWPEADQRAWNDFWLDVDSEIGELSERATGP